MKKNCLLLGLLLSITSSFAQNIFPATGYVGVGTSTPTTFLSVVGNSSVVPEARLDHYFNGMGATTVAFRRARGTLAAPTILVNNDYIMGLEGWGFVGSTYLRSSYIVTQVNGTPSSSGTPTDLIFATSNGGSDAIEGMRLDKNGNVGIGNSTPGSFLNSNQTNWPSYSSSDRIISLQSSNSQSVIELAGPASNLATAAKAGSIFFTNSLGQSDAHMQIAGIWAERAALSAPAMVGANLVFMAKMPDNGTQVKMIFDYNGNLTLPETLKSKNIYANGNIWAKEIKVALVNPWPDFVFSKTHNTISLPDLEKYIQANNHLPNIPSASEVAREGINLGEMNAKLLQKIEELTLHLIEQNKQLLELKSEVEILKKK
ncbi:MAG: hypothetical protein JWQ25_1021 [Daejeonella sp.]|nr:hypothetical protein [Daejeonella sp.]